MQQYLAQLDLILANLFKKYSSSDIKPGVLLSGGIDSSTISCFVSKYFKEYSILSMGTDNSKDRPFVDIMCRYLHHPYEWVDITKNDLLHYNVKIEQILSENDIEVNIMQKSLAFGYFLIFKKASEMGITHVFTGQGPDIILGGYHKYKGIKNVNDEIKKDLPLLEIDKKRDGAMAGHFGITLINPYLEKTFIDFALLVPQEFKVKNDVEKYILRMFAKEKNLPEEIVYRPKKAYQYSTGIQNLLSKLC